MEKQPDGGRAALSSNNRASHLSGGTALPEPKAHLKLDFKATSNFKPTLAARNNDFNFILGHLSHLLPFHQLRLFHTGEQRPTVRADPGPREDPVPPLPARPAGGASPFCPGLAAAGAEAGGGGPGRAGPPLTVVAVVAPRVVVGVDHGVAAAPRCRRASASAGGSGRTAASSHGGFL